jgi:ABC-type polar amino acid transport system ATPase subunit
LQFADEYPNRLSGGQQQRASIVRALAMKPKLMILDEPTSALDPELTLEVLAIIKEVTQSGIMTILATHEMQFAREVSDQVIFMEKGVIVEQGTAHQLFDHPQQARTQQFLAHFSM